MEITLDRIGGFLASRSGPVIADIPLLYETGWDRYFSETVLVYVPEEVQIERLMMRDHLDRAGAVETVSAQMSIEKKRALSKIIIDNSGAMEATVRQAQEVFSHLENERKKY